MKFSLVVLLFAFSVSPAFASHGAASPATTTQANDLGAPGCGPAAMEFDVKTQAGSHDIPAAESGKATVVFLQDDAKFGSRPRPTTRFGIDGTWVGATHANSYFYVSVDPGEHHLCANWQNRVSLFASTRPTAASHFVAEAGKTYYFRAQDIALTGHDGALISEPEVRIEPVDSDEAQILIRTFSPSASHAKK